MSGRQISAREATVKIATVSVKALTISGKQVTLSVFRQLQNEPLILPATAELAGVPWGIVNYFWGDCSDNHLHVVWQKGEDLRRACVYAEPPLGDGAWRRGKGAGGSRCGWHTLLNKITTAAGCLVCATLLAGGKHGPIEGPSGDLASFEMNIRDLAVRAYVPRAAYELVNWEHCRPFRETTYDYALRQSVPTESEDEWAARCEQGRQQRLAILHEHMATCNRRDETVDSLRADISACRSGMDAFVERWTQHYQEIAALDQLFIAV